MRELIRLYISIAYIPNLRHSPYSRVNPQVLHHLCGESCKHFKNRQSIARML